MLFLVNRAEIGGPLEHGGRLNQAALRYGIPVDQWLDLSTGVSPWCYPFAAPAEASWQRLPENDDGLMQAASRYYGCESILALPGSQAAISMLPLLRAHSRVLILGPTYNEHGHGWRQAGHQVEFCDQLPGADQLAKADVLVVVNPNNPTGRLVPPQQLRNWYQQLPEQSWMIVDEAFVDSRPEQSLLSTQEHLCSSRVLVLRSLGKFFGLAGVRVGFALGSTELLRLLEQKMISLLGAWPVSGPAREVAIQALIDTNWQQQQRRRLLESGQRLAGLLSNFGHPPDGQTDLFCWLKKDRAADWQEFLATQGIWCRHFDEPNAIRFGLPATQDQWQRLEESLREMFLIEARSIPVKAPVDEGLPV